MKGAGSAEPHLPGEVCLKEDTLSRGQRPKLVPGPQASPARKNKSEVTFPLMNIKGLSMASSHPPEAI